MKYQIENTKLQNQLYFVSDQKLDGETITPRIPDNYFTQNNYEENQTPRISMCPTINGCLIGLSKNVKDQILHVYVVDTNYSKPDIKIISNKEVPDQSLTEEVWILNSIKLKYIQSIKIVDILEMHTYTYGDNKVANTYSWKWELFYLWHGSYVQGLDILEPNNKKTHDRQKLNRVYATDDKYVALMFSYTPTMDGETLGIGQVNDQWYIKELTPNAFDQYKHPGSVYQIHGYTFQKADSNFLEWVSETPCKVLDECEFSNIYEQLLREKYKIKLIEYNDATYDEHYENIREEFRETYFKTPEELYNFLVNKTEYDEHNQKLRSIEDIFKQRKLDCWEAVEFQNYYLKQMDGVTNVRSFFIGFFKKQYEANDVWWEPYASHTVSIFEYNNEICYLEASWRSKQNIYKFDNWNDAINYFIEMFTSDPDKNMDYIKQMGLEKCFVYEYGNIPPQATDIQFIDTVESGKLIYQYDLQKKSIDLNWVILKLKQCLIKLKEVDHVGYIKGVGIFGSTARGTRTNESDIDIFLDLDISKLTLDVPSIFGIPESDRDVITNVFIKTFGINPYTDKNYITDVVGEYELRKTWNQTKHDIIMVDINGNTYMLEKEWPISRIQKVWETTKGSRGYRYIPQIITFDQIKIDESMIEIIEDSVLMKEESGEMIFNTPNDLYEFVKNNTEYNNHGERLRNIEEMLQQRKFDCWEFVELARYFLSKMDDVSNIRTLFFGFFDDTRENFYEFPCHTIILYNYNNQLNYMEGSWRNKSGIYTFELDQFQYFVEQYVEMYYNETIKRFNFDKSGSYDIIVYEYDKPYADNLTNDEYIDYILKEQKIIYKKSFNNPTISESVNLNTNNMIKLDEYVTNKELIEYLHSVINKMDSSIWVDKGHRSDHILDVINTSIKISKLVKQEINYNILITSAACHDIGLTMHEDRDRHHEFSYQYVMNDTTFKKFFSEDEIRIIAEATYDHRASSKKPPRSIYGAIVADADTGEFNIESALRRSYLYNAHNYPQWNYIELFDNEIYPHLKDKFYPETGYGANYWLDESKQVFAKGEIERNILKDYEKTKEIYINLYNQNKLQEAEFDEYIEYDPKMRRLIEEVDLALRDIDDGLNPMVVNTNKQDPKMTNMIREILGRSISNVSEMRNLIAKETVSAISIADQACGKYKISKTLYNSLLKTSGIDEPLLKEFIKLLPPSGFVGSNPFFNLVFLYILTFLATNNKPAATAASRYLTAINCSYCKQKYFVVCNEENMKYTLTTLHGHSVARQGFGALIIKVADETLAKYEQHLQSEVNTYYYYRYLIDIRNKMNQSMKAIAKIYYINIENFSKDTHDTTANDIMNKLDSLHNEQYVEYIARLSDSSEYEVEMIIMKLDQDPTAQAMYKDLILKILFKFNGVDKIQSIGITPVVGRCKRMRELMSVTKEIIEEMGFENKISNQYVLIVSAVLLITASR